MKKIYSLLILFYACRAAAQNIVPNGSFEDVNTCAEFQQPCSPSAWFFVQRDYTRGYFSGTTQGIAPIDGDRYLNLLVVSRRTASRQYWQTMLLCPLEKGRAYKASVKLACKTIGPNLNDIGFYFADSLVFSRQDTLLQPEGYFNFFGATIKKLRNGWFELEKEFKADRAGQFLIMGNFSKEPNQQIMGKRKTGDSSIFLMIDDVVISAANKKICSASVAIKDSLYAIVQRHIIDKPVDAVAAPVAAAPPAKEKIDTVEINNIRFALNSHTLANPDTLDMLKKFLVPGDVQKVKVIGYTDDSGTEAYNNTLSLQRAREISRLITARYGIPERLIEAEGRGISTLYAQKEQNRRVVVYIYRL